MNGHRRLAQTAGLLLCGACTIGCSHKTGSSSSTTEVASPKGRASAKIEKPVAVAIGDGYCESDGNGSIGANFLNKLAFNIGPATGGAKMLGMDTKPYKGAGTYSKVVVTGFVDPKHSFGLLGTIVVNPDRRTGTFASEDGKASGTWDCGEVLK